MPPTWRPSLPAFRQQRRKHLSNFSESSASQPSRPQQWIFRSGKGKIMLSKLTRTDARSYTLTILRLAAGIVFFAHGAQKVLGWFGGYGYTGTMGFFTQQMG